MGSDFTMEDKDEIVNNNLLMVRPLEIVPPNWHKSGTKKCLPVPERRKISAIRDFPPCCGRNPHQINVNLCITSASSTRTNVKIGDNFQKISERELITREEGTSDQNCVTFSQENWYVGGSEVVPSGTFDKTGMIHEDSKVKIMGSMEDKSYKRKFLDCVSSSSKSDNAEAINARKRVEEILKLFRATCCKLMQDEKYTRRIDLEAFKILKKNVNFVNHSCHQFGHVAGVNVGDKFRYRIEVKLVGLHRPPRSGIDYMKVNEQSLATSIVDSGGYENLVGSKELIYVGQGGNVACKNKPLEDQKLTRGNLALKNSIYAKNPVRVIRTFNSHTVRPNVMYENFIYDGLYTVREYWQELGSNGFRIYKFRLVRLAEQPEISWKKLKKF